MPPHENANAPWHGGEAKSDDVSRRADTTTRVGGSQADRGLSLLPTIDGEFFDRGWPIAIGTSEDGKGPTYPGWPKGVSRLEAAHFLKKNPQAMVGVILGPHVGFWDLEVDHADGLPIVAEVLGSDPPITPTFQRRDGFPHRLFAWDDRLSSFPKAIHKILSEAGDTLVEFRLGHHGAAQSIFPPSGGRRWIIGADDCPFAKPPDCLIEFILAQAADSTEKQRHREDREAEIASVSLPSLPLCTPNQAGIAAAIWATLPSGEGQRNRSIFLLAVKLRGILGDVDPGELRPVLREWHKLALPFIATKQFEESWSDFLYGWPRVKFPGGLALEEVLAAAIATGKHPACAALGYETPDRVLLVSICAELQRLAGSNPFHLSSHVAARLLSVEPHRAHRMLCGLVGDRVLEIAAKGSKRRATRYRLVWAGEEQR